MHTVPHTCRILTVAVTLRLLVLWVVVVRYPHTWLYGRGIELGTLAQSIATGHGLSSPFGGPTGPTALLAPGYPALIAAFFRVFGAYSAGAAVAVMLAQVLFSVLTVWLIVRVAYQIYGALAADLAGFFWAISLPLLWMPTIFWETCLSTLLLLGMIAIAVRPAYTPAVLTGAYIALAALVNPALLPALLAVECWLGWSAWQQRRSRWYLCHALLVFALIYAPWPLRNERVMHAFIPTRSTVGLELWMGNRPGATGFLDLSQFPIFNRKEYDRYVALGEVSYMKDKMSVAEAYIHGHPILFLRLSAIRFARFWTGSGNQDSNPFFYPACAVNHHARPRRSGTAREPRPAPHGPAVRPATVAFSVALLHNPRRVSLPPGDRPAAHHSGRALRGKVLNRLRWVLPSFSDIFFLAFMGLLAFSPLSAGLLGDGDTGWHIRNGERIMATHAFPRTDPFSYTKQGEPWYAWEWLYDVIVAAIHHVAGLNGVVVFTAVVISLTFSLLFHFVLRRSGNLAVAAMLTLLAASAAQVHMLARPHVLSWLFTLLWVEGLFRFAEGNSAALRWLPPLMLLWVNLHAGFVLGLFLLGLFAVEPACKRDGKRLRSLALVFSLCLFATLLTPYGYRLHLHVYQYLSNSFLMNNIDEFRSPDFHQPVYLYFAAFLPLSLAGAALGRDKLTWTGLLLWLFSVHAGLYAARNIPIAAILMGVVLGPLLSSGLGQVSALKAAQDISNSMTLLENRLCGHGLVVLMMILSAGLVLAGGRMASKQLINAHFSETAYPAKAADFIARRGIHDHLFTTDSWGAYLIYRLYPETKVYFDDRHDFYGEEFVKEYGATISGNRQWQAPLEHYQVGWVLMPVDAPLSSLLRESPGWHAVFDDGLAILFTRASASAK